MTAPVAPVKPQPRTRIWVPPAVDPDEGRTSLMVQMDPPPPALLSELLLPELLDPPPPTLTTGATGVAAMRATGAAPTPAPLVATAST